MGRVEGTRGVIVGEGSEKGGDFWKVGGERVPRIAVAVVDNRAGAEDLLDARGILADNTDDHVDEFGKAEGLPDDGTHADVAGVLVGITERDLVG